MYHHGMIDTSKYKDEELVTLREAAAILNVSISTVMRYRDDGKIPYYKYSKGKILYRVSDLRGFIKEAYTPASNYLE